MPGSEWKPFTFTSLNIKQVFSMNNISQNTIKFFMIVLNKTYELTLKLYEEIVLNHDKVHIVSPPEFIESRLEGSVAEILLKNKLIKRSRDFDRDGFRVSYKEWLSLKMIKSFGNSPRNAKSFLKRMGRTSAFKNDVFKRYQANSSLFSTLIADLVGFVQDHDYIDAGDLIGHNDGIIDSCRIEFSINSYKIAHDLA
jgi:hypothetical protein